MKITVNKTRGCARAGGGLCLSWQNCMSGLCEKERVI